MANAIKVSASGSAIDCPRRACQNEDSDERQVTGAAVKTKPDALAKSVTQLAKNARILWRVRAEKMRTAQAARSELEPPTGIPSPPSGAPTV
jgi:hypothetical protein